MDSGSEIPDYDRGYSQGLADRKFTKEDYAADHVFQRLQWEARAAFEEAYNSATGGMHGKSIANPKKGKWFDHWINSKSRAFLIANGLITGEDDYR